MTFDLSLTGVALFVLSQAKRSISLTFASGKSAVDLVGIQYRMCFSGVKVKTFRTGILHECRYCCWYLHWGNVVSAMLSELLQANFELCTACQ